MINLEDRSAGNIVPLPKRREAERLRQSGTARIIILPVIFVERIDIAQLSLPGEKIEVRFEDGCRGSGNDTSSRP